MTIVISALLFLIFITLLSINKNLSHESRRQDKILGEIYGLIREHLESIRMDVEKYTEQTSKDLHQIEMFTTEQFKTLDRLEGINSSLKENIDSSLSNISGILTRLPQDIENARKN